MVRRDAGLPDVEIHTAPGHIGHNPGVTLLWWTSQVSAFKAGNTPDTASMLFEIGDPIKVEWWTEGRAATRAECEAAIERGLPNLLALAESAGDTLYIEHKARELRDLLPEV
jgi:hypothetical protein